jgi:hypothetical protein
MAFVMIAGPQIITSFFLATSQHWAASSTAYVTGAAVSITAFVTIAYVIARAAKSGASDERTANKALDWIVLVLVLVLIVRVYLTRKQSSPPKWMAKLQQAEPKFAFLLGLLLLARNDDPYWQVLPFIALTLLFLAFPSIAVVLLGRRANVVLPKIRDWMNRNSWVVSEIVLLFFLGLTINSLA